MAKTKHHEILENIAIHIGYWAAIFIILTLLTTTVDSCASYSGGGGGSGEPWDGHDPTQYGPW